VFLLPPPYPRPSLLGSFCVFTWCFFFHHPLFCDAGLRIGFVTGPSKVLDRLDLHSQSSCLHPSGVSQALVLALFQHWRVGSDGAGAVGRGSLGRLEEHVQSVTEFYAGKSREFSEAAEVVGLTELVEWTPPSAGMFAWMRCRGVDDTHELIEEHALKAGVLLVPGSVFFPGGPTTPFVRAAFSLASKEDLQEALHRFAKLL
jgi:kynurenine/2-aminoadipate aminotransferase